jgi:hypothetical protein
MSGGALLTDHQFVKTWSERYRRGAANSRWRAGPKLKTAMATHPELMTLSGITNYWDLESYIFDTIGPVVRSRGSLTLPEFLTIGYWKAPRQLSNYRKNEHNDEGMTVPDVTGVALSDVTLDSMRPNALSALSGVRVPVASALLTVWHPHDFTIIDVWALKTLSAARESIGGTSFSDHGQPWWEDHYDDYLLACKAIVARVKPFTLRDVDRALWKWGQLNARAKS